MSADYDIDAEREQIHRENQNFRGGPATELLPNSPLFRGFYPGSNTPLPPLEEPPVVEERDPDAWDTQSTTKIVGGVEKEFFTIGAVAKAMSKSVVSIRLWIKQGYLPPATFRLPAKNNIQGRRLYTRAQIEALISVAKHHQILGETRIDWAKHPGFADDVRAAWKTTASA